MIDSLQGVDFLGLVAVVMAFGLGFVGLLGGLTIGMVKAFKGSGRKRSRAEEASETEMIQEIYHGLNKMGDRIDALETLLLQDDKDERDGFDRELQKD